MTVEVKAEVSQVAEVEVVKEAGQEVEKCEKDESKVKMVEKSSSYREESNCVSDLKEHEKKALNELKTKLEEAIVGNCLFNKQEEEKKPAEVEVEEKKEEKCEAQVEEKEEEKCEAEVEIKEEKCEAEAEKKVECEEDEKKPEEEKPVEAEAEIDRDISIWGVPLLPSKGNEATNVVLLKFLRAREFKVNEALDMLKKTLQWRKEFGIDSIQEEEFEPDLSSAAYMCGVDREGHAVCYNIFGVLDSEEIYEKALATEEKREQFLRWRVQLMERGVQKLDFKPDGANSLVQVNDLKNSPGPSRKDVRTAVNKAVTLLQDNYPEFVAKNVSFSTL